MNLLAITAPGVPELVIIGLIFVLLFGAKKLPELGGAIGKSIKSFKQGVDDGKEDEAAEDSKASADAESAPATRDGK